MIKLIITIRSDEILLKKLSKFSNIVDVKFINIRRFNTAQKEISITKLANLLQTGETSILSLCFTKL